MVPFVVGALATAGLLGALGVTRARGTSEAVWTVLWTALSAGIVALVLEAMVLGDAVLVELTLGAALAYVAGVGFHTLHHALGPARPESSA